MRGLPKILLIVIAGVIAFVVLAVVLVLIFFPADRARTMAVAQLQARLHQPVAIAEAHVRAIPLQVTLKGIEIGGPSPAPNRPVFSIAALRVGVRLLPLLRRQVDVSGIDIDRPTIRMILSKEPPPVAPPPRPMAAQPMSLRIRHLGIHDGAVSILLADGSPFVRIAGLSENLSATLSGGGSVDVTGDLGIDTLRVHMTGAEIGQGIRFGLEHELHYEQGQDLLSVRKGVLHIGGVPIAVQGEVAGLRKPVPILDLSLHGGPAKIEEILGLIPLKLLPTAAEGVKSTGMLEVHGVVRGPAKQADFTVDLLLTNGRIEASRILPQPVEGIRLDLHARPDTIEVREFAARSERTSVRGRVMLRDYQRDPAFRLAADANIDLGAVSGLIVPPDSMALDGTVSARIVAEGRSREPQKAAIDGLFHFASVSARGKALAQPVTEGTGDVLLEGQTVALRGLSLKLGSSDLTMNGSLSNPLAMMPASKKEGNVKLPAPAGRARFDLAIKSGLLDLNPFLVGPRRRFTLALPPADGTISLACDRFLAQKIDARDMRGRAIVDHGVIRLDGFGMQTLGGSVSMNGTVDMTSMAPPGAPARGGGTKPASEGTAGSGAGPKIDIAAEARNIGISDLFTLSPALDRFSRVGGFLSGGLSSRATLQGTLNDSLALDIPTLMSDGNLEILNARLADLPIQKSIAGFLNIPQLNSATIQEWKQAFKIEKGRLNINGLNIRAGEVELSANGWQAIDGTMEMKIDLMLPRQFSQALTAKLPAEAAAILTAGNDARLYVPLTLSGKTASPTVSLNSGQISAAAKAQAQARIDQEKARLAEEAKRQAQQIIQRNIGLPGDSTRRGSPLDSLKIKKDVLNKLGRIFGK